MRTTLVLLVLLGIGCDNYVDPPVTEEEQMLFDLWTDVFGRPGRVPHVLWVWPDRLDCGEGHGWWRTNAKGERYCTEGTVLLDGLVEVGRPVDWTLADTALAHEFAHVAEFRQTGNWNPHHDNPAYFGPGSVTHLGEQWLARLELANELPIHETASNLNARSSCSFGPLVGPLGHEAGDPGGLPGGVRDRTDGSGAR